MPAVLSAVPPGRVVALLRGAGYCVEAVLLVSRYRLGRLLVVPAGATLASFAALTAWAALWLWPRAQAAWAGPTAWHGVAPQTWVWLRLAAMVVMAPMAIALAAVVALAAGQLIASPATWLLSQRADEVATGTAPRRVGPMAWLEAALTALGDAAMSLFYLPLANLALVVLWLVPGLGGLAVVGSAALLVAHVGMAPALARRGLSFRARWQFIGRNLDRCLGLGGVLVACAWIPGLNLLVLPIATVAGTLLCADLLPAEAPPQLPAGDLDGGAARPDAALAPTDR